MESSGSFSETSQPSMSEQLESIRIAADIVPSFLKQQERLASWHASQGHVPPALERYFQSVTDLDISSGLAKLESAPTGTESIMTLFWEWSKQHNKPMLDTLYRWMFNMKIQSEYSILNNSNRLFIWLKSKNKRYMGRIEGGKIAEVWDGRVSTKHLNILPSEFDGVGSEFQIARCTTNVPKIEFYHYTIRMGRQSPLTGWKTKREDAAEEIYKYWYRTMTSTKFRQANLPTTTKKVVLLGTWINADDYNPDKYVLIPDANGDWRDALIFVMGDNGRTKAIVDVTRIRRHNMNPLDKLSTYIELPSGTSFSSSLDWYVYKPEQYVTGEVYCQQCGNIFPSPMEMDMRFVQGHGPLCGPCRDYLMDMDALDESLWD